ncbi:MAG: S8 family serine peptidase, partial [Chloroflexi bacterium]|nr:S8 family serine peptidase [Chloroflexota bacterium]
EAAGHSGFIQVIVQAEPSALDGIRGRARSRGADIGRDLPLVEGFAAAVPASEIEGLADDPAVRRIVPDRSIAPAMDIAAPAAGIPWSRGSGPSAGPTGRGVVVAVIDSGIFPHEDLAPGSILASIDFVNPRRRGNGSPVTSDPYGHGTHIAGIVAGRSVAVPEGGGAVGGVAPDAGLVSLRVLDRDGTGDVSDLIAAITWCIDNKDSFGIRVINLSLGQRVAESIETDPLARAVEEAWRSGLVVVTAAGNRGLLGDGYGTVVSPGNDPLVITVGALDDRGTARTDDDLVADFSSRGPSPIDFVLKPDLAAPGTRIVSLRVPHSTIDRLMPEARVAINSLGSSRAFEPRYFEMSGSSMSAALVSGVVALMLEEDP